MSETLDDVRAEAEGDDLIFLHPSQIDVPNTYKREIDWAKLDQFTESIASIGQQLQIAVTQGKGNRYTLVDGQYRLEACRKLGRSVFVQIFKDRIKAAKWAYVSDLHRVDLTEIERGEYVEHYRRLSASHDGTLPSLNETAKELNRPKSVVHRYTQIGKLTEESKQAVREAGLDRNHTALAEIGALPPDEQMAKIKDIIVNLKLTPEARKAATVLEVNETYRQAALHRLPEEQVDFLCQSSPLCDPETAHKIIELGPLLIEARRKKLRGQDLIELANTPQQKRTAALQQIAERKIEETEERKRQRAEAREKDDALIRFHKAWDRGERYATYTAEVDLHALLAEVKRKYHKEREAA